MENVPQVGTCLGTEALLLYASSWNVYLEISFHSQSFSFCPVHRQTSFSLPLLVGIYLLPFFFFSLAKLHIWASVSSQCFIQTSTQPVTPTVDQPDSMRTLPTPLSLRHLVQRLQFCTIDPCLTYLTAESREPEPHSRSQPFADPTSK